MNAISKNVPAKRRTPWTHLAFLTLLTLPATSSNAGLITSSSPGAGVSGVGSFTGALGVSNNTSTTATISVLLTNTSPAADGGFITAFAFENPGTASGGDIDDVTGFSVTDPYGAPFRGAFALLGGPTFSDSINASPFGHFSIGASLPGGSFQGGGGNPNQGIGVGESALFTFHVTGRDLLNLSPASLEAALNGGAGGRSTFFVVRFRGSDDDGPAVVATPEPGTITMAMIASVPLGFAAWRRRRRATA